MRYLELNNGKHLYSVDSNQVIHSGLKKLFEKHAQERKIDFQDNVPTIPVIKSNVTHLSQVIFEITQNCNLKCKYCSFGGTYTYNRDTASKTLEKETAFKAIDLLWRTVKNRAARTFTIGFYGGEPLLHFEILREIVEYSKSIFVGWDLRFTLTSNAVLLNDEIIRYLVNNKFTLWVSLDGAKANHDSKRLLTSGRGSFDTVIKNLQNIKNHDSEYYSENIYFSAVYSKDLPFEKLIDFFISNPLVKDQVTKLNLVNQCDTNYYDDYPYDESKFQHKFIEFIDKSIRKRSAGEALSGIESEMLSEIVLLKNKLRKRGVGYTAETCLFENRLYIDVDGYFHVCEKINHSFSFGHVDTGFDFEKMHQMVSNFSQVVKDNCRECDFRFLCTRCFIHFAKDGNLQLDIWYCKMQEKKVDSLNRIIGYIEEGLLKE